MPDGHQETAPLPPAARAAVRHIEGQLMAGGFADLVERKASGVALHWRGLDPERAASARAAAERLWDALPDAQGALRLLAFDHGMEFRGAGRDKGTAMRTLLEEAAPGTAAAYLGDDLTDEDAFAALAGAGLGVLVAATPRPTRAAARVDSPAAALAFLERWRSAARPPAPGVPRPPEARRHA
jgi:trehalose-phosphatase